MSCKNALIQGQSLSTGFAIPMKANNHHPQLQGSRSYSPQPRLTERVRPLQYHLVHQHVSKVFSPGTIFRRERLQNGPALLAVPVRFANLECVSNPEQ